MRYSPHVSQFASIRWSSLLPRSRESDGGKEGFGTGEFARRTRVSFECLQIFPVAFLREGEPGSTSEGGRGSCSFFLSFFQLHFLLNEWCEYRMQDITGEDM